MKTPIQKERFWLFGCCVLSVDVVSELIRCMHLTRDAVDGDGVAMTINIISVLFCLSVILATLFWVVVKVICSFSAWCYFKVDM